MNKRIKELAEQAGVEHTQNIGVKQFYFEDEELEKFAELIVRECGEFCGHDHEGVVAMYEHFGVDE